MAPQFIYTCYKLGRFYPPDRTVLEDISLSFYPGAKIGVIGRERLGQVEPAADHGRPGRRLLAARPGSPPASRVGYLAQEPQLDPAKDVLGNVMDGVGAGARRARPLRRGHGHVGRPGRRLREGRRAAGRAGGQDRRRRRLEPRPQRRDRHGRAALPAQRRRRHHALGRRAAAGGAVPAAALPARPPAARRADQPPRRRERRLARAVPAGVPRHRRGRHPRPLLPRQRGPVDPRARPRPGLPVRGQLLVVAGAEAGPPGPGGEAERRPASAPSSASWSGCAWRPRPARPRAGPACRPTSKLQQEAEEAERGPRAPGDHHPARATASATRSSRSSDLRKGYGDRLLIEDLSFTLPRAGIVGVIGPNGAGKTTLFRMLTGTRSSPTPARVTVGDTVELAYVDQSPRRARRRQHRLRGDHRRPGPDQGRQPRGPRPGLRRRLQLQGLGPAEARRRPLGRRAQPRPPGQGAADGRQRAAARRADQRPRRRHAAGAGGRARGLPRLRRGHQPRPLVPRPDLHPRARLRGRQPGPLVRGQLHRVRGLPPQGARRRRRPAPPHQVQAPRALRVGAGSAPLASLGNASARRGAPAEPYRVRRLHSAGSGRGPGRMAG